jgi:hypothetical protein
MTTRIDAPFATSDETAAILGVSSKRVAELRHIMESAETPRRRKGIPWTPPSGTLKQVERRKSLRKAGSSRRRKSRARKTRTR